jgi:alkanesulfonate monooxygenase SsuD/methylene tetrahydromethanopterin reductase-like flavin-dependent oxidoreductase (luciferase family)
MKTGIFLLHENFHKNQQNAIHDELSLGIYAESLGFDEVWFAEHHFNDFSLIPNPSLAMAYLSAKTSKIRLGSAAFLAPFYHSVRLAEEIATLDVLSHGRINAGFAKGGFALDMELFDKSEETLRREMYESVEKIRRLLQSDAHLQPKPVQEKIPFYIATFSTQETIEYAAKNGYGLMFSQGATLKECKDATELYHSIAGVYPEAVVMRVFSVAQTQSEANENAFIATEHFIACMQAVKAKKEQPAFAQKNYEALLKKRGEFFHAKKFMEAGVIGSNIECVKQIQELKNAIPNLHLILKPASFEIEASKQMLQIFMQDIRPHIL